MVDWAVDPEERHRIVGAEVLDYVIAHYGFDLDLGLIPGEVGRQVDDEHRLFVTVSPWDGDRKGGATRATVGFGVARRDINILWHDLFDTLDSDEYRPTVQESLPFFGQPRGSWIASLDSRASVYGWLDEWVPRLVAEAGSLRFIEHYWTREGDTEERTARFHFMNRFPRMANQLLWGWTDQAEQDLMVPYLAEIETTTTPGGEARARREAKVVRIREWIEQHPDGIERLCLD